MEMVNTKWEHSVLISSHFSVSVVPNWHKFFQNDCLKSGTHEYHQMPNFHPWGVLPGLFVGLSSLSFVVINWKAALLSWDQVMTWQRENIPFLCPETWVLGWFRIMFSRHYHLYHDVLSCQFCSIRRKYSPLHRRVHPGTSISSKDINTDQWPGSSGSHTCPCYAPAASTMFDW